MSFLWIDEMIENGDGEDYQDSEGFGGISYQEDDSDESKQIEMIMPIIRIGVKRSN